MHNNVCLWPFTSSNIRYIEPFFHCAKNFSTGWGSNKDKQFETAQVIFVYDGIKCKTVGNGWCCNQFINLKDKWQMVKVYLRLWCAQIIDSQVDHDNQWISIFYYLLFSFILQNKNLYQKKKKIHNRLYIYLILFNPCQQFQEIVFWKVDNGIALNVREHHTQSCTQRMIHWRHKSENVILRYHLNFMRPVNVESSKNNITVIIHMIICLDRNSFMWINFLFLAHPKMFWMDWYLEN